MAEYIDREAALNVCEMHYQHCLMMHDYCGDSTADNIKTDIETIPAADAVEVVRCKDCERCFKKRTKRNKQLMLFCMRMDGREYQVNANDFCSYGVRKGEDE